MKSWYGINFASISFIENFSKENFFSIHEICNKHSLKARTAIYVTAFISDHYKIVDKIGIEII